MQGVPQVELDLDNIQGNIVPGFYKDAQDFFFLQFRDRKQGLDWLLELVERKRLSSAARVNEANELYKTSRTLTDDGWANIALSAVGMEFLGIDLNGFPPEFLDTPEVRAQVLGDTEVAHRFEVGGTSENEAHALLILGANYPPLAEGETDRGQREKPMNKLHDDWAVNGAKTEVQGIHVLKHFRGRSLGNGKEHFGFVDSRSQPVPNGVVERTGWPSNGQFVAPGEFILGQPRERSGGAEPEGELHEPAWAANGSYLVFRAIQQHVGKFESAMDNLVEKLSTHGVRSREQMMATLMGRERDDKSSAPSFYADPYPDNCPFFAHVRKANPRDGVEAKSNLHRIIRRGIPYGAKGDLDVGLLFVAYQASIARQFEHIQTQWLASDALPQPPTNGVTAAISPMAAPGPDPLTGWPSGTERTVMFHVPGTGLEYENFLHVPVPSFVDVIGSGYFFTPAIDQIVPMLGSAELPIETGQVPSKRRTLVEIKPTKPESEAITTNGTAHRTSTLSTMGTDEPSEGTPVNEKAFSNPSNYSVLGAIIEMHRPYAKDAKLPDLRNGDLYRQGAIAGNSPQIAGDSVALDTIDVFGSLAHAGHGHRSEPIVVEDAAGNKDVVIPPGSVQEIASGEFTIRLNNGEPFRITKGLRIPYRYFDENNKPILGNIIVLYNGTGHPC